MNVFILRRKLELPSVELSPYRFEAMHDGASFSWRQHARFPQGLAMGDAALNVMSIKPSIDHEGNGECFDQTVRAFSKPPVPGLDARSGAPAPFPICH